MGSLCLCHTTTSGVLAVIAAHKLKTHCIQSTNPHRHARSSCKVPNPEVRQSGGCGWAHVTRPGPEGRGPAHRKRRHRLESARRTTGSEPLGRRAVPALKAAHSYAVRSQGWSPRGGVPGVESQGWKSQGWSPRGRRRIGPRG